MMPLTLADVGVENTILRISGNPEVKRHMEDMGFVPGADIELITVFNGNVIVKIKGSRVAISEEMARKIMI